MFRLLLPFLIFLCSTISKSYSQRISIDKNSVGFILNDSIYSGTGFVLLKPNYVVTCAHVIDTLKSISFVSIYVAKPFKLRVLKYDLDNDLALLESEEAICIRPLLPALNFDIFPKQHLYYFGYDTSISDHQEKSIQVNGVYVSAIGKVQSGKAIVDFIEFPGVGIPGYSGGPVFNDNGQIVGIMREAWKKQGIKGGKIELINRAFSINPILK